jgi:excisionase family DNA binding protein
VGEARTDRPRSNQRRVPVAEAAVLLGISEGAVRMRVKRGTLPSTREGGRLYVLLNIDPTPEPERPHDGTHDRTSELIATLREQLQAERQAHAEARRIIAGLVERIPAIEAPADTPEASETAEEHQGRGQPRSDAPGPQETVQRPWWRRVFGG